MATRAAAPASQPAATEFERAKAAAEMRSARSEAAADMALADAGLRRAGQRVFALRDSTGWTRGKPHRMRVA